MIRDVVKMGDPLLDEPCGEVPESLFGTPALEGLITDLIDTMQAEGGIGIAAPQIGVRLRVVWIGQTDEKGPPAMALINPVVEPVANAEGVVEQEPCLEGCLSVPGMRGLVWRPSSVRWQARNPAGERISGVAIGYQARVIQHETDHLNGIVYVHRIRDLHDFGCAEAITQRYLTAVERIRKERGQEKA